MKFGQNIIINNTPIGFKDVDSESLSAAMDDAHEILTEPQYYREIGDEGIKSLASAYITLARRYLPISKRKST